jgi:tRNA (guanine-N7-)-methyltransferase
MRVKNVLNMLDKSSLMDRPSAYRPIRSFVRREGRMTKGQKNALERFWPQYGLDFQEGYADLDDVFGRHAPRILEIGMGMGDALVEMAAAHVENDYLGIEVYRPGIGSLLKKLDARSVTNVRVICEDAVPVLKQMIPDASLDAVYIFFPDPWPKKRHHKRRLIQKPFAQLLAKKLQSNGVLHLATDWEDYAHHMLAVMNVSPEFIDTAGQNKFTERPGHRPLTRFEQRGRRLGHRVWDLIFRKAVQDSGISNNPNTPSSPQ